MNRFSKDIDTIDNMLAGPFLLAGICGLYSDFFLGRLLPDVHLHVLQYYWRGYSNLDHRSVVPHRYRHRLYPLCYVRCFLPREF